MDSLLAIGVGLVLRIVVDAATDNDDRVGGVLVGLWEGVILNHFVRRMPHSFDPYLGFGFRIFVDFLFTQSFSRLSLVALWALVGMLLADIAPNVWRDSGLRHLYRQVCKDVRHVKRSVPHIRIKNDLPSVRLFNKPRSSSSSVSSVRSDRAAPSRSPAPSPVPSPAPGRRQGRSPPGTFPDTSGWSETDSNVSNLRHRVVTDPGPSPALIPLREHAAYERIGTTHTTHVATSQTRSTAIQDTRITVHRTQNESILMDTVVDTVTLGAAATSTSLDTIDDPSRHNPPVIPDDWVDIDHPTPAKANEPVAPFQPDPDSTPEPQPGPSSLTQSRPVSIFEPPPAIDVLPDIPEPQPDPPTLTQLRPISIRGLQPDPSTLTQSRPVSILEFPPATGVPLDTPDVDHVNRASPPPHQIPLPESRAASVIGGVFDQPQPRSALRDSLLRSRVDKTTSEIGVDSKSLAMVDTQSTKSQSSSRSWGFWGRSKLKNPLDANTPEPPPKVAQGEPVTGQSKLKNPLDPGAPEPPPKVTQREPVAPAKAKSDVGSAVQSSEPKASTPAEVDPPASILTHPGDTPPLLLIPDPAPEQPKAQPETSKTDQPPPSAGVDSSPAPPQGGAGKADSAGPKRTSLTSLLDLPAPSRTPPPPFTEFAGVEEGLAAGEGPAGGDPVTHDEAPTELTEEQEAAEGKRHAFLLTQVQELEGSRTKLQKTLDKEDDPAGSPANAIESDLEDGDKTISSIKARIAKKRFSEPPSDPSIQEVALANKSATEVQFALNSAVLDVLLVRDDAGPMTIQATINKQRVLKGKPKEAKDAVTAFARRHQFKMRFENATPGIVNIMF